MMSDLDLFRGLAKIVPLEPITNAEDYFAACSLQEEHLESADAVTRLYLVSLSLFIEQYEGGYRPDES
jgi:hypothetical protein